MHSAAIRDTSRRFVEAFRKYRAIVCAYCGDLYRHANNVETWSCEGSEARCRWSLPVCAELATGLGPKHCTTALAAPGCEIPPYTVHSMALCTPTALRRLLLYVGQPRPRLQCTHDAHARIRNDKWPYASATALAIVEPGHMSTHLTPNLLLPFNVLGVMHLSARCRPGRARLPTAACVPHTLELKPVAKTATMYRSAGY